MKALVKLSVAPYARRYYLIVMALLLGFLAACDTTKQRALKTVKSLEKENVEGQWYVIADIPYFAEKNKVATRTTYKNVGLTVTMIFLYIRTETLIATTKPGLVLSKG